MNNDNFHPIPQPNEVSTREREDGMGAYLMMFASLGVGLPLPIINLIAAVVYYYVNRKKSRFVHFHTFQSLLSQFPTSILNAIGVFWFFSLIIEDNRVIIEEGAGNFSNLLPNVFMGYIIMVVIANLIYIIFSIVAASRAYKGRFYYMLFFGRVAYNYVYKKRPGDDDTKHEKPVNLPPR